MILLMTSYAYCNLCTHFTVHFTVTFCFTIAFLILHFLVIFWICIFSLLLSSTAPYPQGPRIYLCPSSPSLPCGSLHLKKSCLLLSESSLPPHPSSLVSPVLRKSVSFSEELFLAASGRIILCQLFNPFIRNHFWKKLISYCTEVLSIWHRMYFLFFLLADSKITMRTRLRITWWIIMNILLNNLMY